MTLTPEPAKPSKPAKAYLVCLGIGGNGRVMACLGGFLRYDGCQGIQPHIAPLLALNPWLAYCLESLPYK